MHFLWHVISPQVCARGWREYRGWGAAAFPSTPPPAHNHQLSSRTPQIQQPSLIAVMTQAADSLSGVKSCFLFRAVLCWECCLWGWNANMRATLQTRCRWCFHRPLERQNSAWLVIWEKVADGSWGDGFKSASCCPTVIHVGYSCSPLWVLE